MKTISIAFLGIIAAFGFGCSAGDPDVPSEQLATESEEVKAGVACGDIRCSVGEVCCNESCGTCVEPGAACDSKTQCQKEPECSSDAHCMLATDTCAECACVALSIEKDQLPACGSEDEIQCFTDPCLDKKAVCQSGQCVVE